MLSTQTKDRLSKLATPNVVYRYECDICHLQYIGLTERRLEERVKEHAPRWAMLGLHGMSQSSVTDHIVGEGHPCNRQEAFEIIYRARNRRLLKYVEAVAIRVLRPTLNIMKEFDYKLKLPWS